MYVKLRGMVFTGSERIPRFTRSTTGFVGSRVLFIVMIAERYDIANAYRIPSIANTCVIRVPPTNISAMNPESAVGNDGGEPAKLSGPGLGANTLSLAGGTPNYHEGFVSTGRPKLRKWGYGARQLRSAPFLILHRFKIQKFIMQVYKAAPPICLSDLQRS